MAARHFALGPLVWLLSWGTAAAQPVPDDRTARAAQAQSPIRLDGELDDAAWTAAEVIT